MPVIVSPCLTNCICPCFWSVGRFLLLFSKSHFIQAPCLPSSVDLAFLWCGALLLGPWCAFLLLTPLITPGNETFPHPVARCSCFQWCLVSIAYSLLGPLMFLLTTSFLFLSGSQLLRFCCPLSPVTSLPSGLWLPWKLPPQRILVGLVLWLAVESDRCNWWWDS